MGEFTPEGFIGFVEALKRTCTTFHDQDQDQADAIHHKLVKERDRLGLTPEEIKKRVGRNQNFVGT